MANLFEALPMKLENADEGSENGQNQELDDATFEPLAYIEQTGDYQQAEAIQKSFTMLAESALTGSAAGSGDSPLGGIGQKGSGIIPPFGGIGGSGEADSKSSGSPFGGIGKQPGSSSGMNVSGIGPAENPFTLHKNETPNLFISGSEDSKESPFGGIGKQPGGSSGMNVSGIGPAENPFTLHKNEPPNLFISGSEDSKESPFGGIGKQPGGSSGMNVSGIGPAENPFTLHKNETPNLFISGSEDSKESPFGGIGKQPGGSSGMNVSGIGPAENPFTLHKNEIPDLFISGSEDSKESPFGGIGKQGDSSSDSPFAGIGVQGEKPAGSGVRRVVKGEVYGIPVETLGQAGVKVSVAAGIPATLQETGGQPKNNSSGAASSQPAESGAPSAAGESGSAAVAGGMGAEAPKSEAETGKAGRAGPAEGGEWTPAGMYVNIGADGKATIVDADGNPVDSPPIVLVLGPDGSPLIPPKGYFADNKNRIFDIPVYSGSLEGCSLLFDAAGKAVVLDAKGKPLATQPIVETVGPDGSPLPAPLVYYFGNQANAVTLPVYSGPTSKTAT
jgi:hypothetical protein